MVTRLNGFSNTGIDIDETVKKLMTAARIPLDKLKQQKQALEWQRDDYRSLNSKVMEFRNLASNMRLQASYSSKLSTSADDSIVSVTSSATATEGLYTLKVNKLAKSASITSNSLGASDSTKTLASLGLTADTTLTVGGEKGTTTIQVKPTDTIASLVANVNGKSSVTGVNLSYDANIDKLFFVSSSTGSSAKINLQMKSIGDNDTQDLLSTVLKLPSGTSPVANKGQMVTGSLALATGSLIDDTLTATQTFKVSVGSVSASIDITKTTTVGKLVDAINNSDIGKSGVSAYLDSSGKLNFFNPDDSKTISFSDETSDSTNILTKLGLDGTPTVTDTLDYSTFSVSGTKAEIEFNGAAASYDSNTFSINGMNFTAKKAQAASDAAVNLTVSKDVDTVYKSIKSFVDKYNELIDTVNTKVTEKRYRDFLPLTDEQREALKDDQIKTWETKAKSGLLRSDAILSRGLTNFRNSFSTIVDGLPTGAAKSLSEIGISTSLVVGTTVSGSYLDNGKIYIDEDKLKKAISEKPDEVMALFVSNDGNANTDSGDGLATRLYNKTTDLIAQITKKAGVSTSVDSSFLMGKESKRISDKIDALGDKLTDLETRYYKQFTAMEKYISQMNSQSAQLSSAFA